MLLQVTAGQKVCVFTLLGCIVDTRGYMYYLVTFGVSFTFFTINFR